MTKIEVEAFSLAVNSAVIRLPGRQFPGVVLQGDSLKILADLIREISTLAQSHDAAKLVDITTEASKMMESYRSVYEETLKSHQIPLPY